MKRNLLVGVAFVTAASLATAGPKGTIPKASADLYLVHADHNGTRIGAALMSPDEVRRVFGFDVDRSCIIVEVALYPPNDKERKVLLSDFSLRIAGTDTAVKPSTATIVAANWRQQLRMQQDVKTELDGEVAFGPGLVHLAGQVRIEKVDSPAYPASEKDAATLEAELTDKGLPEGKTSSPVAGYLYFPVLQGKKHTTLQLDYETDGSSVILELCKPAGKPKNSSPLVALNWVPGEKSADGPQP